MKQFVIAVFIAFLVIGCEDSDSSSQDGTANRKELTGRWYWVKSQIQIKYSDGTIHNVSVDGNKEDWIEFVFKKVIGKTIDDGLVIKGGKNGAAEGSYQYYSDDFLLEILYTSIDPGVFVYRTVDQADSKKLILSADAAMVLRQYKANNLDDLGNKKIVGGSIFEEYER